MQDKHIKLIPGKLIADAKSSYLKNELAKLQSAPKLVIMQIGNRPDSTLYVTKKAELAEKVGIKAEVVRLSEKASIVEILEKVEDYNRDSSTHGIIIQSPLPGKSQSESQAVFNAISPQKDVDGLTAFSLGKVWQLKDFSGFAQPDFFFAATPQGVGDCLIWLALAAQGAKVSSREEIVANFYATPFATKAKALQAYLQGKRCLIVNRSNIVGKPLAALLLSANATITIAHSHSRDLKAALKDYDLIFPATGVEGIFSVADFKPGQVVVDIGINSKNTNQAVKGDVSFDPNQLVGGLPNFAENSDLVLAPVPGGVGPLTVVNLLYNTYLSYIRANDLVT